MTMNSKFHPRWTSRPLQMTENKIINYYWEWSRLYKKSTESWFNVQSTVEQRHS